MIKAVIIGFSHMHVNEIALYISEQPDFVLAAAADVKSEAEEIKDYIYTPKWNLENIRKNYCGTIYDDYRLMLDEVKPDIAFLLCENGQKAEIVKECAKRKINVSVEKPMAISFKEALEIKKAADESGIEVVVNWPVMWRKYQHKLANALEKEIVGKPLKMHYLNGHTGPLGKGARHRGVKKNADEMSDSERAKTWWHKEELGGGVFLDICCYGCLFSKWYLGDGEKSIFSEGMCLNTDFGNTDDNFAAIIRYDGKMSVIEGTWTTPRAAIPSGPSIMCTDGIIMCVGGAENEPDIAAFDIYGNKVSVPDIEWDDGFKNMPWHYAKHIKENAPIHPMLTLEKNLEIMAILDDAIKSAKTGKEEKING